MELSLLPDWRRVPTRGAARTEGDWASVKEGERRELEGSQPNRRKEVNATLHNYDKQQSNKTDVININHTKTVQSTIDVKQFLA